MQIQETKRQRSSALTRRSTELEARPTKGANGGQATAAQRVALGLGWFSIGLGLAELLAPREVARWVGAKGSARAVATLRAVGVRELISGVGLLSRASEPKWLWSRLGGDIVDMALLKTELVALESERSRGTAATAVVLGVAALDGLVALELAREKSAENQPGRAVHVTAAITINRPPEEVYRFWRNLENLPSVLSHLESVRVEGNRSHWRARLPPGLSLEWSAQLDQDIPNELISWRSLPEGILQNHGRVRFTPAPGGRGTELQVTLSFEALGGAVGAAFAKLWGSLPGEQLRSELKRFKQVMETGSIMRSDASVHQGPHPARPSARSVEEGK